MDFAKQSRQKAMTAGKLMPIRFLNLSLDFFANYERMQQHGGTSRGSPTKKDEDDMYHKPFTDQQLEQMRNEQKGLN